MTLKCEYECLVYCRWSQKRAVSLRKKCQYHLNTALFLYLSYQRIYINQKRSLFLSWVQAGVLPLSARGRHLPSSWTHHFTPHTCAPTHHFTPHTCAPTHHSQLSQCVDYLCTSAPSLCLPRLLLPALTCACLYFIVFIIWPITFGFVHSGHQHYVAVWGVPFLIIVLFLPVGFWFNKVKKRTCIWTQISIFPRASTLRRDNLIQENTWYLIA